MFNAIVLAVMGGVAAAAAADAWRPRDDSRRNAPSVLFRRLVINGGIRR